MADLPVNIAGVHLKNPVITASGTYGFGHDYEPLFPLEKLGGISCKGTTLSQRNGNPPPRIAETPSGILNSVGLQNPGIDVFLNDEMPWLSQKDVVVIANIAGSTPDEYLALAEKLNESAVHLVELNISCPNVKAGGASFGTTCASAEYITKLVRNACKKPLIVKLTPNVTDIAEIAVAVEAAGADGISLINTITGMKIDINTGRPLLKNNTGGLSGPAVLPIAVRMVWQTAQRVSIPIIGMGGISKWEDAVEMLLAGACAIQVGTANFTDAFTPLKIIEGINDYLDARGIQSVKDIVGKVEVW